MTLLTKTFALASFTSALAFMALPSLAADYDFPHIETSGASEIVIDADMAVVNIEVVVEASTSKAAKDASDKAISQFLSRLKQAGVEKHDIQSANLSLHPKYHYQKNEPATLKGYQASRRMTITVKQLDQSNDLLDSALEQGINRVNSIELTSSKRADFIEQARQAAIEDAKQKAALKNLDTSSVSATHLAGDAILAVLTRAPGNDASIGGVKVVTKNGWFAARPSGTENAYKIYLESFVDQAHLEQLEIDAKAFVADVFSKM